MAIAFSGSSVHSQESENEKTKAFLASLIKEKNMTGAICCVIKDGKVITLAAVGVRKAGNEKRLRVTDKIHLGSCTKAMTATLIAKFVAAGKIDWTTKLLAVFPNLADQIHSDYHNVTLADLLTHQSGAPPNNVGGWPSGKPLQTLRYELIRKSFAPKPAKPVGQYSYSNLGYITAGAMLEKTMKRKWEDLISEHLFEKLGMQSAGFGPPGLKNFNYRRPDLGTSKKVDQPWGHVKDLNKNWKPIRHDNPRILGPAGTVHCSIEDWAKFVSLHISWKKRDPILLDREMLEFLQSPKSSSNNALGWFAVNRPWGKGRVISHNGSNTYWMSSVWAAPNTDFAVLSATNCCAPDTNQHLDKIASEMIKRFAR